jgi:multidrug resistance efflux pump
LIVLSRWLPSGIWWHSTFSEDTDDAQVNGHLIQVSSRIGGQVLKVDVEENQVVKAGDVIAELDPGDYQVAVENAEAALASAQANAAAANVNVPITTVNTGSNLSSADADVSGTQAGVAQAQQQLEAAHARVAQAKANNTKAQADLERYKPLVEKDVISKQQFDAAVAAADAAKAALADARATEQAASEGVKVAREREAQAQAGLKYAQTGPQQVAAQSARAKQAQAQVQQAQAQLDQAKLNLSYTKDRGSHGGHHHPQERRDQPERRSRPEPAHAGLARRPVGDGQLQGDPAQAHGRRAAGRNRSGRHRQDLPRQGDPDWRRHRLGALALPAGKRHRQLRQGGAARPGAHRLQRPPIPPKRPLWTLTPARPRAR